MSYKLNSFINKYGHLLPAEAQQELQDIEQEHRYLIKAFENNPCTIALLDENNVYLKANPEMLKISPNLIGSKLGELTKEETVPRLVAKLKAGSEHHVHEILNVNIQGEAKVFWLSATKVGNKVLTTGLDITSVKQLEEEKSFNDQLAVLGEMSSFIVHEINNPLSTLMMASELIKFTNEDEVQNSEIAENLEQVFKMVEVIRKIIASLKTVSRKGKGLKQELELSSVIEKSQVILSGKIKKSFTKISVECVEGVKIEANEVELLQVLVNLISNSIDAIQSFEEKWVKIKWENQGLKIIDCGLGIPPEIETKLFNKFYTSKGEKGNGVGLYLSKTLLNKNGFDLKYTKEGNNTCFSWIPLTEAKAA